MNGDLAAARRHVEKSRSLDGAFDMRLHARTSLPFEHAADTDHLIEGIELAMRAADG